MTSIIDTHLHLWDLSKFKVPWLEGIDLLNRNHLLADYFAALGKHSVNKAIYMEIDLVREQKIMEADYVIELSKDPDSKIRGAVCSGILGKPGFDETLAEYLKRKMVKGIRHALHVPDYEPGYCLKPEFLKDMEKIAKAGLIFDICVRPAELKDAVKLAEYFPQVTFVLDHCGNPNPLLVAKKIEQTPHEPANIFWHDRQAWLEDISALGEQKNVICKISGIIVRTDPNIFQAEDLKPVIDYCLQNFGEDRIVFGGDWPVCNLTMGLETWITSLKIILEGRSEVLCEKLFTRNAERIYQI